MAQVKITDLPNALPLTGDESVPIVQNGVTVQTTTGSISIQPSQTQTFLTATQQPSLANSRYVTAGSGLDIVDNGAGSYFQVNLTGAALSLDSSGTGIQVKTDADTLTPRAIAVAAGLVVSNANGVSGNPLIGLGTFLSDFVSFSGASGIVGLNGGTFSALSILGTVGQISVANGSGATGNPTINLVSTGVTPGAYTAANITVDTYGRITSATSGAGSYVTSFSAGTTGLTPATATSGDIIMDGILNASHGGTGANTLTGYVKGNGTSAMTAASTVPTTDLSGTISNAQLANSTISGVSLGSNLSDLTIGTGLSGTSYNGSTPTTISITNLGSANGVATLDAGGTVPLSQIPASIQGGVSYQGTWDATTNTPTLTSGVGTKGYYYVVSVAGSTNLDGITTWNIGDWAIFNGTAWEKIDNTDAVTSVNGYTGTVVLTASDIGGLGTMAVQNANSVAITGGAIDGTTIGGTTPAAGTFTTLTATGQTSLGGAAGSESLRVNTQTSADIYWQIKGGSNSLAVRPSFGVTSGAPNIYSTGQPIIFTTNGLASNEQLRIAHTASAVNYVQVTGSSTSNWTNISAQGSDTNITQAYVTKGSGQHIFGTNGASSNTQLRIGHVASAVNYAFISGGQASGSPTFSVAGSDTNISQVFQSKGTGAIDLAAGSSGVNISNGGTVTAITMTSAGSGYTSFPTPAISAPTTSGGVQAVAVVSRMFNNAATVSNGGTGYTVGDVLTVVGGTPLSSAATLTVSAVSAGVITAVTATNQATYTALPSNPVSVTGGTGSSATLNLTWALSGSSTAISVTTAGSGYVEQPTVTFSGGGGSGAAAYATVGSGTVVKSIGSTLDFYTPRHINTAVPTFRVADDNTGDSYVQISNGNGYAGLLAQGNSSASLGVWANGSSYISLGTGGTANREQLRVANSNTTVNYVQVTGAATGSFPRISTQGSDSSASLALTAKSGTIWLETASGFGMVGITHTAGANNYLALTGGVNAAPSISAASGTNANIPLVLQPKGTGALQAQQTDSTATGGNARGANSIDWQTTRGSASQVTSGVQSVITGGGSNTSSGFATFVGAGNANQASGNYSFIGAGNANIVNNSGVVVGGLSNDARGFFSFIGAGYTNSGTSSVVVTTQSATMNGTTAVTLSGSNSSIKVGQYISGTSIANNTYVAAVSGTSLTLSQAASGSSTSTLSFYTPHGVVVGGGNNQATGSYSFIGGGGDAGTAANRNVASGDWSVVSGGIQNVASGLGSVIAGGGYVGAVLGNTASGTAAAVLGGISNNASALYATILGGRTHTGNGNYSTIVGAGWGSTRGLTGYTVFPASSAPIAGSAGVSQAAMLVLGKQTTDATATVITSDGGAAGTTNQVILPNNSAYYFKGTVVAGKTAGGDTKGWTIEGVIKRGANAASTAIVGTATVTSSYADAGASTWALTATADTTNGGLAITFTGQASTTIRCVAKIETTEMTY